MPDRETIITHLTIIRTWASFARERDLQFFTAKHLEDMATWADEAIALLKEQDAVEPKLSMSGLWYECSVCHRHLLKDRDNYCARCGRRLKWNEVD